MDASSTAALVYLTMRETFHRKDWCMATITQRESEQIEQANATGRTPVVFIHGLWLLASSWERWATLFEEAGYAPLAPGWPDDPETVEAGARQPRGPRRQGRRPGRRPLRRGDRRAEQEAGDRRPLLRRPDRADPRRARPLGARPSRSTRPPSKACCRCRSRRSARPCRCSRNPANRGRAVTLSFEQFRYGWANALGEDEARRIYDEFHVAAPGRPIFQAAMANFNPARRDQGRHQEPRARPAADHHRRERPRGAAGDEQGRLQEAAPQPGGHRARRDARAATTRSTIDDRWREVAETALAFVKRFA